VLEQLEPGLSRRRVHDRVRAELAASRDDDAAGARRAEHRLDLLQTHALDLDAPREPGGEGVGARDDHALARRDTPGDEQRGRP